MLCYSAQPALATYRNQRQKGIAPVRLHAWRHTTKRRIAAPRSSKGSKHNEENGLSKPSSLRGNARAKQAFVIAWIGTGLLCFAFLNAQELPEVGSFQKSLFVVNLLVPRARGTADAHLGDPHHLLNTNTGPSSVLEAVPSRCCGRRCDAFAAQVAAGRPIPH